MGSNKKARTSDGTVTPPRRNTKNRVRRAASEVSREHALYVTVMAEITPGAPAPLELRTAYHKLLSILKDSNESCVFFPVSPLSADEAIIEPDDLPEKMSTLMRHFTLTSKLKEKTCMVWATARLGFDGDFEMLLNHTDYDLRMAKLALMKKMTSKTFYRDSLLFTICQKYYLHRVSPKWD